MACKKQEEPGSRIRSSVDTMKKSYRDCFVSFNKACLKIGNSRFQRTWSLDKGAPRVTSVLDRERDREWSAETPFAEVFRKQELPLRGAPEIKVTGGKDDHQGTSEPHLLVKVELAYKHADVRWTHRIWPEFPMIVTHYAVSKRGEPDPGEPETYVDTGGRHIHPADDRMDGFGLAPLHMTAYTTTFIARTDHHDNLVKERKAVTYPKENMREPGHFFHLVDRVEEGGLLAVKLAPPPDEQLAYPGHDFVCSGRTLAVTGSGIGREDLDSGEECASYEYGIGVTNGLELSGVELFYALYRKRSRPLSDRRFSILSNTWGDGNGSKRMNAEMFAEEIETGAQIGLTHCQLDAGWHKGQFADLQVEENKPKGPYGLDPDFWTVNKEKFPDGLQPMVDLAAKKGLQLGFWFAPDSTRDYANWRKDADVVLGMWRDYGFQAVKIDGVSIHSKRGESHFLSFLKMLHEESRGALCVNFDITGGRSQRLGHFYGNEFVGNLFIENRYALDGSYYTFRTLRNLWQLSRYIPTYRLQMEFVNTEIRCRNYGDDPLAPRTFGTEFSCAVALFANPLCWMEVGQLSESDKKALATLLHAYRPHQEAILQGRVYPVGEEPDGHAWTGFQSVTSRGSGYLIVFREATDRGVGRFVLHDVVPGSKLQIQRLAGASRLRQLKVGEDSDVSLYLPQERSYGLVKYETET